MITATLNNYRQSPRKVRLVAALVRGKNVVQALAILENVTKRATSPLQTLIASAVANAKHNFNIEKDALFVKEIRVDGGQILKRRMPRARGSAFPINKRTSHVSLVLAPKAVKEPKK
ncbi:MAG: 50S ribosomal protein L22 [Candidatus Taylorbacteria bacterium]|nr:50S ribosomal protein L22 [Candidatus Taylorbacteria bacterium]